MLFVASGPAAIHCIAGDVDGRLFTWGRNEVRFRVRVGVS